MNKNYFYTAAATLLSLAGAGEVIAACSVANGEHVTNGQQAWIRNSEFETLRNHANTKRENSDFDRCHITKGLHNGGERCVESNPNKQHITVRKTNKYGVASGGSFHVFGYTVNVDGHHYNCTTR